MQVGSLCLVPNRPWLGPVRVIRAEVSQVQVASFVPGAEEEMVRHGDLTAFPLMAGMRVLTSDGQVRIVEVAAEDPRGLRQVTVVERAEPLSEADVVPAQRVDVIEMFSAGQWSPPQDVRRRIALRDALVDLEEDSDGLPTLFGSRVEHYAHQVYAMERVLWGDEPRFVLADEVGLGKTIEAGLVIQALLHADSSARILIITPDAMQRQWLQELYSRFGARAYAMFSSSRPLSSFVGADRVLVKTGELLSESKLRKRLQSAHWDLIVLDEAHQIPPHHSLYATLRAMSARAGGFLALSATPSRKDLNGLLGLLALVKPSRYDPANPTPFHDAFERHKQVWDLLADSEGFLRDGEDNGVYETEGLKDIARDWKELLPTDRHLVRLASEVEAAGDAAVFRRLVAHGREHHRFDDRLIRSRRKQVGEQGLRVPGRRLETLELGATKAEREILDLLDEMSKAARSNPNHAALLLVFRKALTSTVGRFLDVVRRRTIALPTIRPSADTTDWFEVLLGDPAADDFESLVGAILETVPALPREPAWLNALERNAVRWEKAEYSRRKEFRWKPAHSRRLHAAIGWLRTYLANHKAPVLVFASDAPFVEEAADAIASALRCSVVRFSSRCTEAGRIDAARQFQDGRARILVSDELGGEGRNFQFAGAVLHLDTPLSVARLEQRIGRLDRLGRPEALGETLSVPVVVGTEWEKLLHELMHDVFRVHSETIGAIEFVLPDLHRRALRAAAVGTQSLRELLPDLKAAVRAAKRDEDEAWESGQDPARLAIDRAQETCAALMAVDHRPYRNAASDWADTVGLWVNFEGAATRFRARGDRIDPGARSHFSGVAGKPIHATFSPSQAQARFDLQFIGPGHPLADGLEASLDESSRGRFACARRAVPGALPGQLFVLLGFACWPEQPPGVHPGLRVRAGRHCRPDHKFSCFELPDGGAPTVRLDLAHLLRGADRDDRVSLDELPLVLDECGWSLDVIDSALRAASQMGLDDANDAYSTALDLGRQKLAQELGPARSALEARAKQGNKDAGQELGAIDALLSGSRARVVLDSVLLLVAS